MNVRMMALVIGLMGVTGCSHLIQEPAPNDSTTRVLNEMKTAPRIVASTPAKTDDRDSRLAALERERQQLADALAVEQSKRSDAESELTRLRDKARGIDTQSARIGDLERQLLVRDGELERLSRSGDELDRAKQQVAALTGTVSERDQEIARLKDLSDKNQSGANELDRVNQQIALLKGNISERDQEIARLKDLSDKSQGGADELNRANQQIALLKGNVSERDQEIVRLKGLMDQNHGNADDLDRLKQQMAGLSGAVSERDQEIARLKGLLDQQRISKAEKNLVKLLQPEILKGNVSVHQFGEQLKINLASGLLFDSGKAELKPAGVDVIKRVGGVLKEFPDKQVQVGGYTDNVPIRGALLKTFPNNMELSKARAEHAVTALEHGGVSKASVTSAGHADTEPVADNKTETGRRKNRRVEIVVQ